VIDRTHTAEDCAVGMWQPADEDGPLTREEYEALPFAQVVVNHSFPAPGRDHRLAVCVDGKPVARLAATKIAFEHDAYSDGYGRVTLTLVAGDCQVLASRPENKPRSPSPAPFKTS
jgi:hypothetical protein